MKSYPHLALAIALLAFFSIQAATPKPKVTFRAHIETGAATGLAPTQVQQVLLFNPEQTIYVRAIPEISENDIETIEPQITTQGIGAMITLNRRGRVSLSTATNENLGRILVFMLNGRVIYAPVIDMPITQGRLLIPRGFLPEEIEMLKKQIKKNR
jgi:preprotein translocase subunit SecD